MKKTIQINKHECRFLYGKFILRIDELENNLKGLKEGSSIPWKEIYQKLGRNFAMSKLEVRETIIFLHNLGFVDISTMGVKTRFKII